MSHLQYASYPGFGSQNPLYSQAVVVPPGPQINISGQGGWDSTTGAISSSVKEEMAQAFDNVDLTVRHALKEAGYGDDGGMAQVYKLTVYYTEEVDENFMEFLVENMKKWFPNHAPTATAIGVRALSLPGMRIEIEALAHVNK